MFWDMRRGDKLLCTEIHAYKEMTSREIDAFEVDMLLLLDTYASNRIEYHRQREK